MYRLLFQQFLRTKTCQFGLVILLSLGCISIITGKQFLIDQQKVADQVIEKQRSHIARNVELHGDNLPLLLYYLKFTLLHATQPLAGLSIGQRDLNPSVQMVTILTLEGQKYDTDLVNPTELLYGNLDLSFIIVYIFPLLIIAFTYNLYSEEEESGTWKLVNVMAKSKLTFLLAKLSVRLALLVIVLLLLLVVGGLVLGIPFNSTFFIFTLTGLLYLIFWFALCFWIVCLKHNSNANALALLSIWLILVVLLPAFINNYITTKHPVPEALSTIIKQRDGYHEKWDTNKKGTLQKFYKDYPQFAKYGFPSEEGFNWSWYYAMQHMGDVESREVSKALQQKIRLREEMSKSLAMVIPSMHTQLALNKIAGTNLLNHMDFLEYTNDFHEKTRLYFYPKIFSNESSESVNWNRFKPEKFQKNEQINWIPTLLPLLISILILVGISIIYIGKL